MTALLYREKNQSVVILDQQSLLRKVHANGFIQPPYPFDIQAWQHHENAMDDVRRFTSKYGILCDDHWHTLMVCHGYRKIAGFKKYIKALMNAHDNVHQTGRVKLLDWEDKNRYINSPHVKVAVFNQRAGYMDSQKLYNGLLRAVQEKHVMVFHQSRVVHITPAPHKVLTPDGMITCRKVVLAHGQNGKRFFGRPKPKRTPAKLPAPWWFFKGQGLPKGVLKEILPFTPMVATNDLMFYGGEQFYVLSKHKHFKNGLKKLLPDLKSWVDETDFQGGKLKKNAPRIGDISPTVKMGFGTSGLSPHLQLYYAKKMV